MLAYSSQFIKTIKQQYLFIMVALESQMIVFIKKEKFIALLKLFNAKNVTFAISVEPFLLI